MLKGTIPLTLILLFVSASNGQTPQTAQDYLKSGMAHFQSGAIDAALADANKALGLNANYVVALYLRAAVRSKKGDTAGVLADYNKIIVRSRRGGGLHQSQYAPPAKQGYRWRF